HFSLFPLAGKPNYEGEWWNVCSICAHRTDTYLNLSKLCCVLLSMNAQNVVVERGFSLAHHIKTKAHARLHVK
uniref:HAT C-terminal dimerisation domain-containing protein n=1 Tax=Romanomermis culicivorax TaxID=13658 RepID=A0A915HRD0_ROMCU